MKRRVLRMFASALALLLATVNSTGLTARCAPLETDEQQQQEQQQEEQENEVSTEDSTIALDDDLYIEGVGWLVAAVSLAGGAALGAMIGKAAYNG